MMKRNEEDEKEEVNNCLGSRLIIKVALDIEIELTHRSRRFSIGEDSP